MGKRISKEEKEIIVKDVLNLLLLGYKPKDIARDNADIYYKMFGVDESYLFDIVKRAFEKSPANIRQAMLNNRKIKEQNDLNVLKREIVDEVLEQVKKENCSSQLSKLFAAAVEKVRLRRPGISSSVIREYVRELEPDFFEYYAKDGYMDETYMVNLAESVINNKMKLFEARHIPGYERMMEYVEKNRPDLYSQIKELYKGNSAMQRENIDSIFSKKRELSNNEILDNRFNNVAMIKSIMFEFRVPYSKLCDFINAHKDLFLKEQNVPLTENETIELFTSGNFDIVESQAIAWFNEETFQKDQYSEYRENRFDVFVQQFSLLKETDSSKLEKFVKSYTSEEKTLETLRNRNQSHEWKESYKYTHEELLAILKYCYKYALYDKDVKSLLNMTYFKKIECLKLFEATTEDELALVDGVKRLCVFHTRKFDAIINSSNKKNIYNTDLGLGNRVR